MSGAFLQIEEIFRSGARHEIEAREEFVREDEQGGACAEIGFVEMHQNLIPLQPLQGVLAV
jgi:hypothetical protein